MTVDKHNLDWTPVERALSEGTFSGYKLALLETDHILRDALRRQGIPGRTDDQRLRAAAFLFSRPDELAHARVMRRKILEERGFNLSREDTKILLAHYYRAISDVMVFQKHHLTIGRRFFLGFQHILPSSALRTLFWWIACGSVGISLIARTDTGRNIADAAGIAAQWVALVVVVPVGIVLAAVAARSARRKTVSNETPPPHP